MKFSLFFPLLIFLKCDMPTKKLITSCTGVVVMDSIEVSSVKFLPVRFISTGQGAGYLSVSADSISQSDAAWLIRFVPIKHGVRVLEKRCGLSKVSCDPVGPKNMDSIVSLHVINRGERLFDYVTGDTISQLFLIARVGNDSKYETAIQTIPEKYIFAWYPESLDSFRERWNDFYCENTVLIVNPNINIGSSISALVKIQFRSGVVYTYLLDLAL